MELLIMCHVIGAIGDKQITRDSLKESGTQDYN